ncbi:radical SAM protein [Proteinivorax tanatarense]|uniref:Radical SAM protein n=1 Tax=Proteinivorax tanatarense TaxID=1260629 RepID=A0AAU7VP75_9FIRM
MLYDMPLYRPPSEAKSAIIQVTVGCSHNKCSFCSMYKEKRFTIKSEQEILYHINDVWANNKKAKRVFLADGNVLTLKTKKLLFILQEIKKKFSSIERISCYAGPKDILNKTEKELELLNHSGLDMFYLGVESGNDEVLKATNKGVNSAEMIEAGQKSVESGFVLSTMIISGLGGKAMFYDHAIDSAKVISKIKPHYFSVLTLMIEEGTELSKMVAEGRFEVLSPNQVIEEMSIIISNLDLNQTVFRANHPSNYFLLAGVLNKDKERLVGQLEQIKDSQSYRKESWRGL